MFLSFKGIHSLLATAIVPFRNKSLPDLSDNIQIARGDMAHLRHQSSSALISFHLPSVRSAPGFTPFIAVMSLLLQALTLRRGGQANSYLLD